MSTTPRKHHARVFWALQLGGWTAVTKDFFDPEQGALVAVEQKKGVPTKK